MEVRVTRSRRNLAVEPEEKEISESIQRTPVKAESNNEFHSQSSSSPKSRERRASVTKMKSEDLHSDSPVRVTRSRRSISLCSTVPDSPVKSLSVKPASPESTQSSPGNTRKSPTQRKKNPMTPTRRIKKNETSLFSTVDSPKPRKTRLSLDGTVAAESPNLRRSRRLSTELNVLEEDPIREADIEPLPNIPITKGRRGKRLSVVPSQPSVPEEMDVDDINEKTIIEEPSEKENTDISKVSSDIAKKEDDIQMEIDTHDLEGVKDPTERLEEVLDSKIDDKVSLEANTRKSIENGTKSTSQNESFKLLEPEKTPKSSSPPTKCYRITAKDIFMTENLTLDKSLTDSNTNDVQEKSMASTNDEMLLNGSKDSVDNVETNVDSNRKNLNKSFEKSIAQEHTEIENCNAVVTPAILNKSIERRKSKGNVDESPLKNVDISLKYTKSPKVTKTSTDKSIVEDKVESINEDESPMNNVAVRGSISPKLARKRVDSDINENEHKSNAHGDAKNDISLKENKSPRFTRKRIDSDVNKSEHESNDDENAKIEISFKEKSTKVMRKSGGKSNDEEESPTKNNISFKKNKSPKVTRKSSDNSIRGKHESNDEGDEIDGVRISFIDSASDAGSDYESGDSMSPSERLEIEENEIVDEGESIHSNSSVVDSNDSYENDSFVCSSDEADDALLSGTGDDLSSGSELNQSKRSKEKYNEKQKKENKRASREMYEARHSLSKDDGLNKSGKNKFDEMMSVDSADSDGNDMNASNAANSSKNLSTSPAENKRKVAKLNDSSDSSGDEFEGMSDMFNQELSRLQRVEIQEEASASENVDSESAEEKDNIKNPDALSSSKISVTARYSESKDLNPVNSTKSTKKRVAKLNSSDTVAFKKVRLDEKANKSLNLSSHNDLKEMEKSSDGSANIKDSVERLNNLHKSLSKVFNSLVKDMDALQADVDEGSPEAVAKAAVAVDVIDKDFDLLEKRINNHFSRMENRKRKLSEEESSQKKRIKTSRDDNSAEVDEKVRQECKDQTTDGTLFEEMAIPSTSEVLSTGETTKAKKSSKKSKAKSTIATSEFNVMDIDPYVVSDAECTRTAGKFNVTSILKISPGTVESTTAFKVKCLERCPKRVTRVDADCAGSFANFKRDMLYGGNVRREAVNVSKKLRKPRSN